jgi:hypothetical protein
MQHVMVVDADRRPLMPCRPERNLPKTHWLDAACVGHSVPLRACAAGATWCPCRSPRNGGNGGNGGRCA